jgi:hypothetical protein
MMPSTSLRDYPMKFDSTALFKPEAVNAKPVKLYNRNESESGHDLLNIRRADKFQANFTFNCTDEWEAFFHEYNEKDSFDFTYYETRDESYKTITVWMDNFTSNWEPHSDYITVSKGLYVVSFDLIQL